MTDEEKVWGVLSGEKLGLPPPRPPELWLSARQWVSGLHDAELLLWLLASSRVKLHGFLNSENHRLYAVALEAAYERNLLGHERIKLPMVELVVQRALDDAW